MAFQSLKLLVTLPESVTGLYFFPYTWFRYGLDKGFLEIVDLEKFTSSLQGSVISEFESRLAANEAEVTDDYQLTVKDLGESRDLWLGFKPGNPDIYVYYVKVMTLVWVDAPTTKSGKVGVCDLKYLDEARINEQKTINNSIIQQFAGCGVKMHESVWYRNYKNVFSYN